MSNSHNQSTSSALRTVKVLFKDSRYNYSTSVNGSVSERETFEYFVGTQFNPDHKDGEVLQTCIGIEFEDGFRDLEVARDVLYRLGLLPLQVGMRTGLGHGGGKYRCDREDTILNKFAAQALSAIGVMGCCYGTDSQPHHRGHALKDDQIIGTYSERPNPIGLYCAQCGGSTVGRQWHNQDIGFGICPACAEKSGIEDHCRNYGVRGVHFDVVDPDDAIFQTPKHMILLGIV